MNIDLNARPIGARVRQLMVERVAARWQLTMAQLAAYAAHADPLVRAEWARVMYLLCPRTGVGDPIHEYMMAGDDPGGGAPYVDGVLTEMLAPLYGGVAPQVRRLPGPADYQIGVQEKFEGKEQQLNLSYVKKCLGKKKKYLFTASM